MPEGHLAAHVTPQSSGKPMLIHTDAADLEILGTQFNVTADASQTKLIVNQGRVRLKQHTDEQEVEVGAVHAGQ